MALTHAGAPLGRIIGSYGGSAEANAIVQPPIPTLARGVDQVAELSGRLSEMHSRLSSLADTIGGPRPVAGEGNSCRDVQSGIVDRLHTNVGTAHSRITEINELIDTISRQLG